MTGEATNHVYTPEKPTKPKEAPIEPGKQSTFTVLLKDLVSSSMSRQSRTLYGAESENRYWRDKLAIRRHLLTFTSQNYPKKCKTSPELTQSIVDTYLDNAIIVAKVWANYDATEERFYKNTRRGEDSRYQDCGQIILSPQQRARVYGLDFEMKWIELHIGTAFNMLFKLLITHNGSNTLGVRAQRIRGTQGTHHALQNRVIDVRNSIMAPRQWAGVAGLKLSDLDYIASQFQV